MLLPGDNTAEYADICRSDVEATLKFINDPSAGSPTETLLRLLLPLNDQVRTTSQQSGSLAGSQ